MSGTQHKLLTTLHSKGPRAPPVSFLRGEKKPRDIYEASKTSRNQEGWQVFFPNDEPSFYFLPFTRAEFDDVIKVCLSNGLGVLGRGDGGVAVWLGRTPRTFDSKFG